MQLELHKCVEGILTVGPNIPLRDLLNLRLRQSREIRRFGGNNSLKLLRMMNFEILGQEPDRATLSRTMSDENDLFGVHKVLGDLFVIGVFLGDTITFVMSLLAVDQMMVEAKGIIRSDSDFWFRPAAAEIVVDVSNMMVDGHRHPPDLVCLGGYPKDSSFFQKPSQSRYLLHREIMSGGASEETSLRADRENIFIVSVWLYLADLANQISD